MAAAMIAGVAEFQSQLTARSATRSSAKMAKKMPTSSSDGAILPRRHDYGAGPDGEDEWCRDVEKASDNYGKTSRVKTTSDEHDQYFWSFSQYAKRQGFPEYAVRVGFGENPKVSSGTGMLKPTYDDDKIRVAPWQLVLSWMLDLGSGSLETPKGGHRLDEPWRVSKGWLRCCECWHLMVGAENEAAAVRASRHRLSYLTGSMRLAPWCAGQSRCIQKPKAQWKRIENQFGCGPFSSLGAVDGA